MDTTLPTCSLTLETPEDAEWQRLLAYLPPDLEQTARRYGALRRKRGVPSAAALLRLMLAYASGQSLRTVAARAGELEIAHLGAEALDNRLRGLVPWLGFLVGQQLAGGQTAFPWGRPLRIRLLDASTLPRPGATSPDWRLHLGLDLRTGLIDHLSVTGENIGEQLADLPVAPGDLAIADRAYATRAGIAALTARQAFVLVRLTWQNLPLQHRDGRPVDLWALLRTLAPGTQGSWEVQTAPDKMHPAIAGRLVVQALPAEQAALARQRVTRAARKQGKEPSVQTLAAAGYILVFTTVPATQLTTAEILALYRMRWQVEITFKRSKSALHLADYRAQTDALCYAVLLAKCLLLLLVETVARTTGLFSPSGHAPRADEPVSSLPGPVCDAGDDPPAPAHHHRLAGAAIDLPADLFYGPATTAYLPA